MGDWNSNTPAIRGLEWMPKSARTLRRTSAMQGWAMRFKGTAATYSHVHTYASVSGTPGLGVEILDTLVPVTGITTTYPGTDVTNASWTRSTGAGTWFSHVDDAYGTGDYVSTAIPSAPLEFRGAGSALSGQRIQSVRLNAYVAGYGTFRFFLNLGGVRYYSGYNSTTATPQQFSNTWALNPSTGVPWTMAQANLLIQAAGTDEFGIDVTYNPFAVWVLYSMWMDTLTAVENRKGFLYTAGFATNGWVEQVLGSTSALSANTYYWVHCFPLAGNASTYLALPVLKDPDVIMAASASATTGEHRLFYETQLYNGGVISTANAGAGELSPVLVDVAGTIQTQSNPYADVDIISVYAGSPANFGTEITLPAGTAYGAVKIVAAYSGLKPDGPLKIDVRTGGGSLTGGGTLAGTAYLYPTDVTNGAATAYLLPIDTPFTPGAAAVYVLYITSTATAARPWALHNLDTGSSVVTGTTAAEVQGASAGWSTGGAQVGTDNSYFTGGTLDDRYDLVASIAAAPAAPTGLTVTPAVGG